MKTWLNALRYYLVEWIAVFRRQNKQHERYKIDRNYFYIPILNWKKYYAKRKYLLNQAAATFSHSQQSHYVNDIIECPNCGQETYMKVGTTLLYRCFTCDVTPKEWK